MAEIVTEKIVDVAIPKGGGLLSKAVATVTGLAGDYLAALLADYTGRKFSGQYTAEKVVERLRPFLQDDKHEHAQQELQAYFAGLGMADEEMFAEDLVFIWRRRRQLKAKFTDAQYFSLLQFFEELPKDARRRMRAGHVLQKNQHIRGEKLAHLAALNTRARRLSFLGAAGYLDKSIVDELLDGLKAFDQSFIAANRRLDREHRQMIGDIRNNSGRPAIRLTDAIAPWRWRFLNLLNMR